MFQTALTVQALLQDNVSGSSVLLRKTIDYCICALDQGAPASKVLADLNEICAGFPSMIVLQNFRNFFQKIPLNTGRIKSWLDMYTKHETGATQSFAKFFSNYKNVLVHSNSGLLASGFAEVRPRLNIFCTESRPGFEGRLLAERLAQMHHRVYLVSDLAAFSLMNRVEVLAFGCDAITSRGVINKIGTSAYCKVARDRDLRTYFIATSEKQTDQWSLDFVLRQGPPAEMYTGAENIHVENYYFDLTPPEIISGVFLESGLRTDIFTNA